MEASSRGIPPPPLPLSMFPVKRSFSTPCDPRDEGGDDGLGDPDGCNLHLSQRLAKTPPLTPKKGGKMLALKIQLLDDTVTIIQAQTKALGRVVFDQICKQLNVLESDYFGLEYQDSYGTKYWLDLEKRLSRQVGLSLGDPVLRFSVKFYTPDPSQLEEEFTRYLFSLQIKRDLATGVLQCNDNTAALMASFIVQAECGDFNDEDYPDAAYLSTFKFVPHQDLEMEKRIRENHRKHCGQSPAEADLHLLETARRTELFGIKMHPGKDDEGVPLNLSVCHLGIVIFQNFTKINTFSWAKIRKLSFKRKRFILKLHPEGYGYYKETVEFVFETRNDCKSFWKRCVEHHAFFRCEKAPQLDGSSSGRSKGLLTSRGSSFRYSGRTQKQMVAFVRENFVKRGAPPVAGSSSFQRSASFRSAHNVMSSGSGVSGSGGAGGGHHSGVSTSCSSPAMMSAASAVLPLDDQMDKIYPHMDYPDSPVEIRSQDSQQDTLSPGTSVTSSPQRYMPVGMVPQHQHAHHHQGQQEVLVDQVIGPPPPQVAALYHPQYPPQGESPPPVYPSTTSTTTVTSSYTPEQMLSLSEEEDSLIGSSSSNLKLFAGSFGQHEFPVTTYRNVERKLKTLDIPITPLAVSPPQPKEIIRRTRKQRSKSLTVRSEIVSEDDDEINFFTIPRRKEKVQKRKINDEESASFHRAGDETTSQGSYDLLVSSERVDELPTSYASAKASPGVGGANVPPPLHSQVSVGSNGKRNKLIHQKESFYEDVDEALLSPISPAPPQTIISPPTPLPPQSVTPPQPAHVPAAARKTQSEERYKPVLHLKSEEQLVEEAGIWLEGDLAALSASGSFKRKLRRKQQQQQQHDHEHKPFSSRSRDSSVKKSKNSRLKSPESANPVRSLPISPIPPPKDYAKSVDDPYYTGYSPDRSPEARNFPIEVDVQVKRYEPGEMAPKISKPTITPRKSLESRKEKIDIPPPLELQENIPDVALIQPRQKVTTKILNTNTNVINMNSDVKKASHENKKIFNNGTEYGIHKSESAPNGLEPITPPPAEFDTGPIRSYIQIPVNEIHPLSKSFDLETLIEDSFENELITVPPGEFQDLDDKEEEGNEQDLELDQVVPETTKSSDNIPREHNENSRTRKNPVRKTKSEGAFDSAQRSHPSALKRSSTEKKSPKSSRYTFDSMETSKESIKIPQEDQEQEEEETASTPTKSTIRFEEVDVPYLLRRRIDLDSISSNPGSTSNFYHHHHHESLSKSKSYGGTTAEASATASQLKRLVFCSMTDLPPATNYSWRDDTMDCPPVWDEMDPFSFAVRRQSSGSQSRGKAIVSNMRKIKSEEIETLAADLIDDISKLANVEFVKDLNEIITVETNANNFSLSTQDISTIEEEQEVEEEGVADVPELKKEESDVEISPECDMAYEVEEGQENSEDDMKAQPELDLDDDDGVPEELPPEPIDFDAAGELPPPPPIPEETPAEKEAEPEPVVKAAPVTPTSSKPPIPEKPMDLLLQRKLRKDSTASMDEYPLPPQPDSEQEYNCETPRYPPPPPDILQFNYPSRRGSYNRRRSSADMEQGSMTDSLTTVIENAAAEANARRLHLNRTFSVSQEEDEEQTSSNNNAPPVVKPTLPTRRHSITDEANIPPSIPEEPTPTNPLPPPLPNPVMIPSESLSKQSSSDSLPDPPDPIYDMVESRNSDTVSEHSESPEAPLFLNLAGGTIGFPRTLSRISERTHSSEETDSTSQFIEKIESGLRKKLEEATSLSPVDDLGFPNMRHLNHTHATSEDISGSLIAPLVTLTSELADSSATLNDLEEINNEEVEDFPMDDEVGNVNLPVELRSEIVVAKEDDGGTGQGGEGEEDDNTFGAQTHDDTTTTSHRHRVEVSLTVRDGRIVFEEK